MGGKGERGHAAMHAAHGCGTLGPHPSPKSCPARARKQARAYAPLYEGGQLCHSSILADVQRRHSEGRRSQIQTQLTDRDLS